MKISSVLAFLRDITIFDQLEEVMKRYQLPEDRLGEFLDLTDAVIKGNLEAEKMPEMIAQAFGVEVEKAQKIAADVAGYRLLPLAGFLPEVEGLIKTWGGDVASYPKLRIDATRIRSEEFLEDFAVQLGLELPDHLMKRFVYLSRAYLTKERAEEPTKKLMMRPINIGGLALTEDQAARLIELLKRDAPQLSEQKVVEPAQRPEPRPIKAPEPELPVPIKEEKSVSKLLPPAPKPPKLQPAPPTPKLAPSLKAGEDQQPHRPPPAPKIAALPPKTSNLPLKATVHALTKDVPVVSGSIFEEDQLEIAQVKKELSRIDSAKVTTHDKKLEEAIERAVKPVIPIFQAKKISRQTSRELARAFVKGMRDDRQTRALFEERHKLRGEDLDVVMAALREARKVFEGSELSKTQQAAAEARGGAQEVEQLEKQVLDERHAALTGKLSETSVEPPMPQARVSAARPKAKEVQQQKEKVSPEKLDAAKENAKPQRARARLSRPSLPPSSAKAQLQDVKKAPKLIGPVEELGTMTITEFRRLSSDPVEAAGKIADKLALLEEDRYEERIRGVKAWRGNPINQLYLEMSRAAITNGISIAEIATERRNSGQEALSPAEVKAIVDLNAKIRF